MELSAGINKVRDEVRTLESDTRADYKTVDRLRQILSHMEGIETGLGGGAANSLTLGLETDTEDFDVCITGHPYIYRDAVTKHLSFVQSRIAERRGRLETISASIRPFVSEDIKILNE